VTAQGASPGAPAAWLVDNLDLLAPGGRVLDVACGRGRHALFLAGAGFRVRAVDLDPEAIDAVRAAARDRGFDLEADVLDLEAAPPPDLGQERYDAIVVIHYLHRPLFPALVQALAPGGVLVYETFTIDQATRGRPTNPAYLLQPGELATLVAPLVVVREREGDFDRRSVASIVAAHAGAVMPNAPEP
jgi:SAM-dependent methyltransferase